LITAFLFGLTVPSPPKGCSSAHMRTRRIKGMRK